MAHVVGIVGKSGMGKSTGARYLNPETTLYINADKKPLPFKGWQQMYTAEKGNYIETDRIDTIKKVLKALKEGKTDKNADVSHFKRVIIDTGNAIMIGDEFRRMHEKGFDKWQDLASAVYDIINICQDMKKNDIIVYFLFHEESYVDDDNIRTTRILTNGKKLNKIDLATRITTILWAKADQIEPGKNDHYFETRFNNNSAKSPDGMFELFKIPNDFTVVERAVREYDGTQIAEGLITNPNK